MHWKSNQNLNSDDVIISQLQSQIMQYSQALGAAQGKYKKARGCLATIAEKVCDSEYGAGQLGGKNQMSGLSDMELRDFVIKNTLEQKVKFTNTISSLQQMYFQEQREKEELGKKYVQLQQEYNQLAMENSQLKNQMASRPVQPVYQQEPVQNLEDNEKENSFQPLDGQRNVHSDYSLPDSKIVYVEETPYDVAEVFKKLDVYQQNLLMLIGEKGKNEQPEILDEVRQDGSFGSDTVVRRNIKDMIEKKVLLSETLTTPIRKKTTLLSLSEIGKEIYRSKAGRLPVKDEMTKIKEMHATLPHGYCIKETASVLSGLGYSEICMDSSENSITVADGRRYVPDITAVSNGIKTYWEVELGHHHDNDMADKLSKASKVAKTVYIVVDKKETKLKLQQQVNYFRKQMIKQKVSLDFIVYVGTLNELADKVYLTLGENKMDLRTKAGKARPQPRRG